MNTKVLRCHISLRLFMLFFLSISIIVFTSPGFAIELIGVVSTYFYCGSYSVDPDTGELTTKWIDFCPGPLAFHPYLQKFIVGGQTGLWIGDIINEEVEETWIVSEFLDDPTPPTLPDGISPPHCAGLNCSGPLSMAFHPSGDLYAVVEYDGNEFLIRFDGDVIDNLILNPPSSPIQLEIDVVGFLGGYGSSPALFDDKGFMWVNIAFNFRTAELFGVGVDLGDRDGQDDLHLFKIQFPATEPILSTLDFGEISINYPVNTIAAHPISGDIYAATGYSGSDACLYRITQDAQTDAIKCGLVEAITSLVFIAHCTFEETQPPVIQRFRPGGGNAGILVEIEGEHFCAEGEVNIASVLFGDKPAMTPPTVWSNRLLTPRAPDAPDAQYGKIKLVSKQGDVVESSTPFSYDHLIVLTTEISQGIPTHPLVAGKDTLVRLFTASSQGFPVMFGTATLYIKKPNNAEVVPVTAECYTPIISNGPWNMEISHRHNINFYVSGDDLDAPGIYEFEFEVRAFSLNGPGRIIYSSTETAEFVEPPGNFRVLYAHGYREDHPEEISPSGEEESSILKVFQEASRVLPVRNGIGWLGGSAGVQIGYYGGIPFRMEYTWYGNLSPCQQLDDDWESTLETWLEEYNEANCDHSKAEYIVGFMKSRSATQPNGQWGTEELGCMPGLGDRVSVSVVYSDDTRGGLLPMYRQHSVVAIHEFGHCMGRVGEHSPNYDGSQNHSINDFFPPGLSSLDVRAFNVPGREALTTPPRSVMHIPALGTRQEDGEFFFEEYEYNALLTHPRFFGKFPDLCPIIGGHSDFYILARIEEDDSGNATAEVIKSYIVQNKSLTEVDPSSPYSLVFLDASSQILAQDPFTVSLGFQGHMSSKSDVVSLTRPLPEGTARVQIRKEDQILTSLNRSLGIPEITQIISPSYGESFGLNEVATIEWIAHDPDGDPLRFSVSYSPNPNDPPEEIRWLPIASGISETSILWNTGGSPGTDNGQLRFTVTDGFNATIFYSDLFSVAPKPPMVSIVRPDDGKVFQEFDSIVLEAMTFDLESGVLDGSRLSWSSTNGTLGTGRRVVLGPGTFSAGLWPINLMVTDGDSNITRTIYITVLADSDRDGLSDDFENQYDSQDPSYPYDAGQDVDGDGLTSLSEDFFGTNPENPDTDGDGESDGQEIAEGSSPNDSTPPIITPTVLGTMGTADWYISDVTISWDIVDEESGLLSKSGCDRITVTEDTDSFTFTCAATSGGGTTSNSVTIRRDATAPAVTVTTPPDSASYLLSETVISNYSCSDNLSGVSDCYGSVPNGVNIDTATVGFKNITVSSSDYAGNTTTRTHEYSVQYRFIGFLPPIRNDGSSIFKSGRTVPVKFQLTDDGYNFISDASATLEVYKISDDVLGSVPVDSSGDSNPDTAFRYDLDSNQYIYNLSTKGYGSGTYLFRVILGDGTNHEVQISLR
jgi:hypothetical protein